MYRKKRACPNIASDDTQHTGGLWPAEAEDETQLFANRRYRSTREHWFVTLHFVTWLHRFLRTSTWSGSNMRYRRKAMRAVSWHQDFTVMTSLILYWILICFKSVHPDASKIAVLWHFTILDEFDIELLRRFQKTRDVVSFHTPTLTSCSEFKEGLIPRWIWHMLNSFQSNETGMNT